MAKRRPLPAVVQNGSSPALRSPSLRRAEQRAAGPGAASSAPSAVKPPAGASVAAQALQAKAEAALKKQFRGETLSNAEISAVGKYEKAADRDRRAEAYARCTPSDLAGLLAVGREQLRRWASYGLPRNEDGSYNLGVFLPRLLDHERARVKAAGEKAVDALEVDRRVRAATHELEFQQKKGELGPLEHFRAVVWNLWGGIKRTLEGFPRRIANDLANLDAREHELAHAREVRKLLARFETDVRAGAGEPPPAVPKAKP